MRGDETRVMFVFGAEMYERGFDAGYERGVVFRPPVLRTVTWRKFLDALDQLERVGDTPT